MWQPILLVTVKTAGAFAGGFLISYGTSGNIQAAVQHACLLSGGFLVGHIFPQPTATGGTPVPLTPGVSS